MSQKATHEELEQRIKALNKEASKRKKAEKAQKENVVRFNQKNSSQLWCGVVY
jgi:hypothetical protein